MSKTIDELLEKFKPLGKIHIHMHDDFTYSAKLELFIKSAGVAFEIQSGFKNKTALTALKVINDRLKDVISTFTQNKRIEE